MFFISFLILAGIFIFLLVAASKVLPEGLPRNFFYFAVCAAIVAYPFAYKLTPTYAEFNTLCAQRDRYQVIKTRPVSFIYIEWGFASDCTTGPQIIDDYGYSGFDCRLRNKENTALYRYTKTTNWHKGCGLECFDGVLVQGSPESNYRSKDRYGFIDGKSAVLTGGYGVELTKVSRGAKLVFHDRLLVDDGVMAYGRDYTYYPYGDGWAKMLGLASGSAPSQSCPTQFIRMDLRDVYKPRLGANIVGSLGLQR